MPKIGLQDAAGNYIATLYFHRGGEALPQDSMSSNGQALLHYRLQDFENALDLLRNEKPMYLLYSGSGPGFENGIRTSSEPVGEGEI